MNIESYREMLSRYMKPNIVERTMDALNPHTNGLNQKRQLEENQTKYHKESPNGKMVVKKVV